MTDYRVTYVVRDVEDFNQLVSRVHASVYLAEIEAEDVRLAEVQTNGELFNYPATQRLIKRLNEKPEPPAEGEWGLVLDEENKVGDDVD